MARDTMKGEKNKQPAAKARMNQGGASMPGKASEKTDVRKAAGKAANRRADRKAPAAARKRDQ